MHIRPRWDAILCYESLPARPGWTTESGNDLTTELGLWGWDYFQSELACVASVSVWFRSKERPRNGILGFGRARNETRAKKCHFSRGLWLSFSFFGSLLLNRTETLATQANHYWPIWTLLLYQIPNCFLSIVFELKRLSDSSLRACLQGERVTLVLR